jgi:hypothetical protein
MFLPQNEENVGQTKGSTVKLFTAVILKHALIG